MTTLERITQLKKEGKNKEEIISNLKENGISPMEINDGMNQAKIKEAIDDNENSLPEPGSTDGMTPSIMDEQKKSSSTEEPYLPPETEEYSATPPQKPEPINYDQEQYYEEELPEEEYPSEEYSQESYSMDSDTMIEVAEQVFSEKIKKLEEIIKSLKEFETIFESKVKDINQRLKRIENQFDKTQIAILDRVGSFGNNITQLQKEVNMVEDSFEKMNKKYQ